MKDLERVFPGRVQRTNRIGELLNDDLRWETAYLCGRVVGLIDGQNVGLLFGKKNGLEKRFILQDESGKIEIGAENLPTVGTVMQVLVEKKGKEVFLKENPVVLAGCEDFYISLRESPNYKKMVIDGNLRENLLNRSKILAGIRDFFVKKGFLETDTPELVKLPGMEPYLDVFKTRFEADFDAKNKISEEMYLITSPEYAMKKLLVGGMEKIFQITKAFRNKETFSDRHNPEFTILEWYRAFASYLEIMDDTEALVKEMWLKFGKKDENGEQGKIVYKGHQVDIMKPWERLKVVEAFEKYAGIGFDDFVEVERMRKRVLEKGYRVDESTSFDDLFYLVFMNEIEPKLGMDVPVILYDYPVSMAALSKRCEGDDRFAERFEAYVAGLELCNAFTELNDPFEQEKRLKMECEERVKLGKDKYNVDQTFVDALKFGMPPSGGNALGVDRLIMLILNEPDIQNVMYFPHKDL